MGRLTPTNGGCLATGLRCPRIHDRLVACERCAIRGAPVHLCRLRRRYLGTRAVGLGVGVLGPSCEADPSPSWRYSPSGSGRASLMSLWARQVRGVLPVRIKPVVAQTSGVPGLGCTAGSVPGYGQGRHRMRNRRADRSDGVVIRLPGVAESNATFARSRAIVTAFARWSNSPMSRLVRRCGVAGSPLTTHDLVVLESRTCRVRRLVHARGDRATPMRNRSTSLRRIREPG